MSVFWIKLNWSWTIVLRFIRVLRYTQNYHKSNSCRTKFYWFVDSKLFKLKLPIRSWFISKLTTATGILHVRETTNQAKWHWPSQFSNERNKRLRIVQCKSFARDSILFSRLHATNWMYNHGLRGFDYKLPNDARGVNEKIQYVAFSCGQFNYIRI